MAPFSSESARGEDLSPVRLHNPMCCYLTGSEPGVEGRADIVKLRQASAARLDSSVKLAKSPKKCVGSCDATNPSLYHPKDIGVNPVCGPLRLEIFKKRTQSGIAKVNKELGLKLACFRPEFFDVNFAPKEALFVFQKRTRSEQKSGERQRRDFGTRLRRQPGKGLASLV
ncbi:MAG TPA: hypothetical protein VGZ29_10865 [Terriglobia bacterium]|nr:hypothetical protein [Terriglobia bacterium]